MPYAEREETAAYQIKDSAEETWGTYVWTRRAVIALGN